MRTIRAGPGAALRSARLSSAPPRSQCNPHRVTSSASRLLNAPALLLGSGVPVRASPCRGGAAGASRRALRVNALFEKFTERSIKSVMIAQREAKGLGASEVQSEHILLGLIAEDEASKAGYLNSGLTTEKAKGTIEGLSGKRQAAAATTETINFSRGVRRTFEIASNECKRSGVSYISPEHILLALLNTPENSDVSARIVLEKLNVDCNVLKREANRRLKGEIEAEQGPAKPAAPKENKQLKEFCKDLNAAVEAGKLDPVIGRTKEVCRVTQILGRRTKNNPILLGEPGVGKTAIAEGLALAIVTRVNPDGSPLPRFLYNKRVMALDVGRLIAGTKERGEMEQRLTGLLAEAKADGNIILMIDEVHTLVGAGSSGKGSGGGLDIANMIKPALARGEFQCIGATTLGEFRKYIESDPALERRFQPVFVNEPTEPEAIQILEGLREKYERHHKCVYTEEALAAAVKLSTKYIADRFLPDKAIDLMDEAGSRARIVAFSARVGQGKPRRESPKVMEYLQVLDTMNEAAKDELYEEASILKRRKTDYRAELSGPASSGSSLPVVDEVDIQHIVASWTGIPVENMRQDDKERLIKLPSLMKEHVIGQDEAVDTLASALMRARCGLKDPDRPIASLLFVGPTGVGKTEVAKVLAEQYFGSRDAMIRLDMSEYMERHSVSKLIGAPPGYIGYGEGGKLTEAVRRRPSCLILMDEVEKAHPDVFNLLLQILEDGRLTDSQGRVVSFKNALLVLTSNIGARMITGASRGSLKARLRAMEQQNAAYEPATETESAPAYASSSRSQPQELEEEQQEDASDIAYKNRRIRETVMEEVKQYFRPELLNRLDEQVVFGKLGRSTVRTIAGLMIEETALRVRERGYWLQLTQRLVDHIIAEGYSEEYGVRPLRAAFVRYIEDSLADVLLAGNIPQGSVFLMDLEPGTGNVIVNHSLESVSVADHSSGFNGEIKVVQDRQDPSRGGLSRSPSKDQMAFVSRDAE